jgi:DNA end-binding protein Ku
MMPDGEAGDERYAVLRDDLAETGKVSVGQLILTGREHLIGIRPFWPGARALHPSLWASAVGVLLRCPSAEASPDAVRLATQIIKTQSGPFEPETMPDEYAAAVRELVQAKIDQRAPEIELASERWARPRRGKTRAR